MFARFRAREAGRPRLHPAGLGSSLAPLPPRQRQPRGAHSRVPGRCRRRLTCQAPGLAQSAAVARQRLPCSPLRAANQCGDCQWAAGPGSGDPRASWLLIGARRAASRSVYVRGVSD